MNDSDVERARKQLDTVENGGEVVRELVEDTDGEPAAIYVERTIELDEFDAEPETIVAAVRAECDHRADEWETHPADDGMEIEAECRRCGALLYHHVAAADLKVIR